MAEGGALWGAVQELRKMSLYKVRTVPGAKIGDQSTRQGRW